MRGFIIISAVLFSISVHGQQLRLGSWTQSVGRSFGELYGTAGFSSAEIQNKFINEMVTKDFLTRESRQAQIDGLNFQSRLGGDYTYGFGVGYTLPNPSHQISLWVSDEAHAHAIMPKDLLSLGLLGNKGFAGDTAFLTNAEVNFVRFQKLGIGWLHALNPSTTVGLRLSMVNAETLFDINSRNSSFYTSSLGDTLYVDVDASVEFSDTGNLGFARQNGGGVALDAAFSQIVGLGEEYWQVDFVLSNLGWVQWHPGTTRMELDEEIEFIGLEVGDITQVEQGDIQLLDSLEMELENSTSNQTTNYWLPGGVQLSASQFKSKGLEMELGAVVRWRSGYLPFAWVGSRYQFNESMDAGLRIGYGGYARTQVGVNFGYRGERLGVQVRVDNLDAMILAQTKSGAGLGLSLQYLW